MSVKALFLDFDGVLWDSEVAALRAWRETYAEYGLEMSLESFGTMLGTVGGVDPIEELERSVGYRIDREAISERRWRRKMELVRQLAPRPGVMRYLADARDLGLSVALVSTGDMGWITTGLEILGLLHVWDFIECAEGDPARAKPSPALYLAALDRLGIEAVEAVAIEDSPNGIRAAKRAGLFCLGCANDVTRQFDLGEADVVVDSLEEVSLAELVRLAEASSRTGGSASAPK